ncbi:unnamed protein product [Ostreobium quekettii]|uniref:Uncharacterized protein n=1 Tax=Ostreobium quekettii TaxID=121088 RepID=A0A8S1J147_9CHLO|nr:unnamed protein product [Ostreobium quekettii]
MANAIPAVGSRISLVSSGDIRYEGILYSIDMVDSKIALQQVKSFGTEGRRVGEAQVPPSEEVYEYIVFRGSDIKELNVLEYARSRPAGLDDPAIISAVGPGGSPPMQVRNMNQGQYGANTWGGGQGQAQNQGYQGGGAGPSANKPSFPGSGSAPAPTISITPARPGQDGGASAGGNWWQGGGAPNGGMSNQYQGRGRGGPGGPAGRGYGVQPGRGYYRGGRRGGGPWQAGGEGGMGSGGRGGSAYTAPRAVPPPVPVPNEDFNFEEQNAKFKKDDVAKEEAGSDVPKGTYAKDEFFDTMSCEALEKLGGANQEGRRSFAEQRKVDVETFGGVASNMNRRGRWGSRGMRGQGRGRGRGYGRGRGRGYYHNYQSYGKEGGRG